MIRESLNQGWLFVSHPKISVQSLAHSDAAEGVMVDLPHDAMIHEPRSADAPGKNQSGFYPGGTYCYIKRLNVPLEWRDQKVELEFGCAYKNASVYINGALAGGCRNGYTEFRVDTDGFLHYGEENEIKVMVNNLGQPSCRWYSGSGLYRGVSLLRGGRARVGSEGVRLKTVWMDDALAMVEARIPLMNDAPTPVRAVLRLEALDAQGRTAALDELPLTLYGGTRETLRRAIQIHQPQPWSCETPALYTYRVRLMAGERELDLEEGRFGVRTLAMDGRRGLLLNGRPVKLRGSCIHHDNGILGACAFAEADARRVRQMKEAGFNCIRCAHNPASRALLDACDEQGMLVMDEYADMWTLPKNPFDEAQDFSASWRDDLASLVRKDYNHPSVILYCLGNEIPEAGGERGAWLCRQMDAYIKELDDSRLTANGVNALLACSSRLREVIGDLMKNRAPSPTSGGGEGGMDGVSAVNSFASLIHGPLGDAMFSHPIVTEMLTPFKNATDITGLNYMPSRYGLEGELHPDRLVLGTEEYPSDIVRLWGLVEKYPHVIGDMTWTGYDYLGEAGIGIFYYDGTINFMPHWPDRLAYIGDIDILGRRRPISYFREIVYGLRKEPYIAVTRMERNGVQPNKTSWMFKDNIASWTWRGFEDQTASVDVYSDAPRVELLLNGASLGVKPAGHDNEFTATFEVPYRPGTLTARALRDGRPAECFSLETADADVRLCPRPEGTGLNAGSGELLFIPVCLADAGGRENPQIEKEVTASVEGPVELMAFGTARPSGENAYDGFSCSTYDAQAMAVIRAGKETGAAKVVFTAEGCEATMVRIDVK